jgi:hypothetical protein
MMDGGIACSTCSTNLPTNAWQLLVARRLKAIVDVLSDLFILRGIPGPIRSDNGPEFVADAVQQWIRAVDTHTAYIERAAVPGKSTRVFATNSSTARSSTRYARRRSSLRVGGVTATASSRTRPSSVTNRQPPRRSCPRSPRGRPRSVERLRRPRWRPSHP